MPSDHQYLTLRPLFSMNELQTCKSTTIRSKNITLFISILGNQRGNYSTTETNCREKEFLKRECLVMRKSPLRFSLAKGFPRCKTTMKSTRPTRSGGGRLAEQTLSQGAHLPCSHLSDGTGFNSSFVIPVCSQ